MPILLATALMLSAAAARQLSPPIKIKPLPKRTVTPSHKTPRATTQRGQPAAIYPRPAVESSRSATGEKASRPTPAPSSRSGNPYPIPNIPTIDPRKVMAGARLQKVLARCNSEQGRWIAKGQGISLQATGSPVRHTYGRISLFAGSQANGTGGKYAGGRNGNGWHWGDLWYTSPVEGISTPAIATGFPTVSQVDIPYNGSGYDNVNIQLSVQHGQGEGGDKSFLLAPGPSRASPITFRIKMHVPSCGGSPEFSAETQQNMTAALDSDDEFGIIFVVRVTASRQYPDIK